MFIAEACFQNVAVCWQYATDEVCTVRLAGPLDKRSKWIIVILFLQPVYMASTAHLMADGANI
jgi:hypothetical protein